MGNNTIEVSLGTVEFAAHRPFALIAGPCALQSHDHALMIAEALAEICQRVGIGLVFKSSFDKANRTAGDSARGVGLDKALEIFTAVREKTGLPVVTDVHEISQCATVAQAVDMLQIPAFLCRQTDLLRAAGATGLAVNIKKGQFLAPQDMQYAAAKVAGEGNQRVLLTERGTTFGYRDLVVDMRGLALMAEAGYPVIFDATHAVQSPGGGGGKSSGNRAFVPTLARAALGVGVAGLFVETHEDPDSAPSDGPNMLPLADIEAHLRQWQLIDQACKQELTKDH